MTDEQVVAATTAILRMIALHGEPGYANRAEKVLALLAAKDFAALEDEFHSRPLHDDRIELAGMVVYNVEFDKFKYPYDYLVSVLSDDYTLRGSLGLSEEHMNMVKLLVT